MSYNSRVLHHLWLKPGVSRAASIRTNLVKDDDSSAWELKGEYAAFLSHFKLESAGDARYMKDKLELQLGAPVFLDSDDLLDLRKLCKQVLESDVVILLLTKGVLTRPWCLIELYHAITNGVPIVTVNVADAFPFDFADARTFFADFESQLDFLFAIQPDALH